MRLSKSTWIRVAAGGGLLLLVLVLWWCVWHRFFRAYDLRREDAERLGAILGDYGYRAESWRELTSDFGRFFSVLNRRIDIASFRAGLDSRDPDLLVSHFARFAGLIVRMRDRAPGSVAPLARGLTTGLANADIFARIDGSALAPEQKRVLTERLLAESKRGVLTAIILRWLGCPVRGMRGADCALTALDIQPQPVILAELVTGRVCAVPLAEYYEKRGSCFVLRSEHKLSDRVLAKLTRRRAAGTLDPESAGTRALLNLYMPSVELLDSSQIAAGLLAELAEVYDLLGDPERALELFTRKAVRFPTDAALLERLAAACARDGGPRKAVAQLQSLLRGRGEEPGTHFLLGVAFRNAAEEAKAGEAFGRAVALREDWAEARYLLGMSQARLDRWVEAAATWTEAVALAPGDYRAHYWLGRACETTGAHTRALTHYSRARALALEAISGGAPDAAAFSVGMRACQALTRHEEAVRLGRQWREQSPGSAEPHVQLGRSYAAMRRLCEAGESYEKAVELAPAGPGPFEALAELHAQLGRHDTALAWAEQAHARAPNDLETLLVLVRARTVLGRHTQALQALRQAAKLAPEDPLIQWQLGTVLRRLGQRDRSAYHLAAARSALQETVTRRPSDAAARRRLGAVCLAQHDHARALESFKAAARIRRNDVVSRDALAAAYLAIGRPDKAIEHWQVAATHEPKNGWHRLRLGTSRNLTGHHAAAVEDLTRAVRLFRAELARCAENPAAHDALGAAFHGLEKFETARSHFVRAVQQCRDWPAPYRNIVPTLLRLGRPDRAVAYARHAVARDARDALAHARLGAAYCARGDATKAAAACRKALALDA